MPLADRYKEMSNRPGTVGMEIVLSIALPMLLGYWIDQRFGTSPIFMLVFFGFGCGAAGKAVYRAWKYMQEVAKREEAVEGNPPPQFPKEDEEAGVKRDSQREERRDEA